MFSNKYICIAPTFAKSKFQMQTNLQPRYENVHNKHINIIMFNNSTMGLIRKNQHQQYNKRFLNCDFTNPNYEDLARAFGIKHKRIETESDLDGLFKNLDFNNDINLVEIMIDKDAFPSYLSKR